MNLTTELCDVSSWSFSLEASLMEREHGIPAIGGEELAASRGG